MSQFVSLDGDSRQRRLEYRLGLAADLMGNPVPLQVYQRAPAGVRARAIGSIDLPSCGGSSLSIAVSEQLELEARDRELLRQLRPHISDANVRMLEGIFLEDLSLDDIARREGRTRQAVSQRLGRLCRRHPALDARWSRDKGPADDETGPPMPLQD